MKDKLKQVIDKIMTGSEIDALIKFTKGREKKSLIAFKENYPELKKDMSGDIPVILLITSITSPLLWQDIACGLIDFDKEEK